MEHYVYRHIRLDKNEPFYIGVGKHNDLKEYHRAKTSNGRNKIWHSIVNKTPYEVEIMLDHLSYEQAREKEIEFILLYGKKINGTGILVNITDGGDGTRGNKLSAESRRKISDKNRGRKLSEEKKKELLRYAHNMRLPENRQAARERAIELMKDNSRRERISKSLRGKMVGDKNPNYGKQMPDEQRRKISITKKGTQAGGNNPAAIKIVHIPTGTIYGCAKDVAKLMGFPYKHFTRKLKGTRKNNTEYAYLSAVAKK